jgi:hypothetical protein
VCVVEAVEETHAFVCLKGMYVCVCMYVIEEQVFVVCFFFFFSYRLDLRGLMRLVYALRFCFMECVDCLTASFVVGRPLIYISLWWPHC